MSGIRSITLGTTNIDQTIELFRDILGMNYRSVNQNAQFGDAEFSPGTCIQFVEVPELQDSYQHYRSIGLRIPTDDGLEEYQALLDKSNISYSDVAHLNQNEHFGFNDSNHQYYDIYSNETNSGIPLGVPSDSSNVSPFHQITGLGPIILNTNEPIVTGSLLTQIFGFKPLAEYTVEDGNKKVIVFTVGDGGLGGEVHVVEADEAMKLPEFGIFEQLEFTAPSQKAFETALEKLKLNEIPFQELKSEERQTRSIRVNDTSGIAFIFTLDEK
ncbi:glyoxalase [Staphylococcus massiliensis]|uniref:Glyoxalase family protein n=1 Tax=Staphylococcus massiliensis S46 TaxID=1229783 RepID=K9AY73_9STAP|nr:glyoxalase [Staphylococcus massiliensis]EKU47507.1 glyoxalase family protein [Staphylococcus massiliensis S46]MCG3401146.1 VOC family protein [Staphylococcus massiliensis]MCG3412282.1 VOC family protein [Staphylococcus massiliensis]PNZ99275.1 lactoylglutathione lyase [Staphylococcus massiliensis CCUG 55927]